MRTQRVAVIGGGVGGLTAAGLLAKEGHSVTLFEGGDSVGGKARAVTVDGVTLDTGPTLLTLPDLVRGTFERLGALDLLPPLTELEPQCAYRFADGCALTAYKDLERTAASASEEVKPSEGRGVRGFYAEAAAIWYAAGEPYLEAPFEGMAGFMARVARRGVGAVLAGMKLSSLHALAAKHFRTDHLRQFVGRFATYAGASPYEASAAFALIPHIERAYGVHHARGGVGALVEALGVAVRRLGVTVRLRTHARFTREGSAYRVGPTGDAELFDGVVVNADPLASLRREDEPLALSGFVLLLEVEGRPSLPHHTVLFGGDYRREFDELFGGRLATDPTVYFCNPSASDATMAPPGRMGLFVMVNAPPLPRAEAHAEAAARGWELHAERVKTQMFEKLHRHFPELRGRVRVLGQRSPVDLAAQGAPGGSIYGFLPHGKLGPFRRPRIRGNTPGLFFTGGGTHPGGGVPLVMLSGRFAAELASAHLRRGQ
ncbi:phytoene desaturase family protein [Myxococcus stipitatus]|uniref:phytoene desaturase family protein n=1 Tax=Myxococcus stipitatus TaxID=83455 RepID=UPI001F30C1BC|nr:phytoene desaturase family protein [Myxococcus stipitatus]MCE9672190.1 phytoene desaturase family protein [Myxococcus stipitatus]